MSIRRKEDTKNSHNETGIEAVKTPDVNDYSRSNSRKITPVTTQHQRVPYENYNTKLSRGQSHQIINRNHSENVISVNGISKNDNSYSQRELIPPTLIKNSSYQDFRNRPKISVKSNVIQGRSQRSSYASRNYSRNRSNNDISQEKTPKLPEFGYREPQNLTRNHRQPSQKSITNYNEIPTNYQRDRSRNNAFEIRNYYKKDSSRNASITRQNYNNEPDAYNLKYAISRLKKDAQRMQNNHSFTNNYEAYSGNNTPQETPHQYNQQQLISPTYQKYSRPDPNQYPSFQQQNQHQNHHQIQQRPSRLMNDYQRDDFSQQNHRVLNFRENTNSREVSLTRPSQTKGLVKARSFLVKPPQQNQQQNYGYDNNQTRYQRIKKSSSSNSFAVQNTQLQNFNLAMRDPATTRTGFNNSEYDNSGRKGGLSYGGARFLDQGRKFSIDVVNNQNNARYEDQGRGYNLSEKKDYAAPNFLQYANFRGQDVSNFGR